MSFLFFLFFISSTHSGSCGNEQHQTFSRNAESSERNGSTLDDSVNIGTSKAGIKKKMKKRLKELKIDSMAKVGQDHESVIQQMLESTLYKNTNQKVNSSSVNSGFTLEAEAKKETSTIASIERAQSTKKGTQKSDNSRKKKIEKYSLSEKGILRVVQPESSSKLATKKVTKKKKT